MMIAALMVNRNIFNQALVKAISISRKTYCSNTFIKGIKYDIEQRLAKLFQEHTFSQEQKNHKTHNVNLILYQALTRTYEGQSSSAATSPPSHVSGLSKRRGKAKQDPYIPGRGVN